MGKLFVVATPIGNLGDITYRAVETLKIVDRIVAEDTRVTKKLLDRYEIRKPMTSLRERSIRSEFERVANMVEAGETIAYVTDAGTPGISDPGNLLVSLVREKCGEKSVVVIPGPSALAALVSVAGMQMDEFVFIGFLPHKKGRQTAIKAIMDEERPVVLYESPHRISKLFTELTKVMPERRAVIGRELTKLYEQIAVGTVSELLERIEKDIPARGEFVVVIAP